LDALDSSHPPFTVNDVPGYGLRVRSDFTICLHGGIFPLRSSGKNMEKGVKRLKEVWLHDG
jgi:hypothetical protein